MNPILIDVSACCEHHTNDALEQLHKAISDGSPDDIWLPSDNPFVSRLIELITARGLMRIESFVKDLRAWSEGERYRPGNRPARPDGAMQRWTDSELALVRLYLETLPPTEFTIDDHMLVIDFLAQRYFPVDDIRSEADWLATRSVLMGRVQANMENLTQQQADTVLMALPVSAAAAEAEFSMTPMQRAVMDFGRARCAENMVQAVSSVKSRTKRIVMRHQEKRAMGDLSGPSLESDLRDAMGELNKDWRRIALTETAENQNQGYIASLPNGTKVRRVEQYRGACPFCRKIDGVVMEVTSAANPDKDGDTQIWAGKTNIGRSASPRRRQAGALIERQPDEMWWIPAGTAHPHCRGRWVEEIKDRPQDDPEFGDYLRELLRKK